MPLDNFRQQYAKNAVSLRVMLTKAEAVAPKKFRGYTVADLTAKVERFEGFAAMDDADLRAHLSNLLTRTAKTA